MPNSAIGLTSTIGFARESVYGTPVAPARWLEVTSAELERNQEVVQSAGLRSQTRNLRRGSRRALTQRWAEGTVAMEVQNKGLGLILESMLGATGVITTPTGGTLSRLHTYALGSPAGKSLTVQSQLRDADNALVQQLTYHGGMVTGWTISVAVGEIATLEATFDFEDIDKTFAAGSPTYPAAEVFHFGQASIFKAGVSLAKVTEASVEGANNLKTDSFFLGTGGLKGAPFPNDFPEVTGSLSAEFDDITKFYDAFAADTAFELRLELVSSTMIEGAIPFFFKVIISDCRFTGGTPTIGGPDVVVAEVPFEAAYDGTNPGISILYQTSDTAP